MAAAHQGELAATSLPTPARMRNTGPGRCARARDVYAQRPLPPVAAAREAIHLSQLPPYDLLIGFGGTISAG